MRRATLVTVLLLLLTSLFLLSVLSNTLTGYPESAQLPEAPRNREETDAEEEPLVLLFKVSPVTPQLYWRITSADYYSGLNWLRTTNETVVEDFPHIEDYNATRIFTVELNSTQREVFLPVASANSNLENLSVESIEGLELFADVVGNVFRVIKHEPANQLPLIYNVSWNDVEIDDRFISLDDIPEEFLDKYLQLPNIPYEVWQLAEDLKDPSYSVLDQILADVQFLRTNFTYDTEKSKRLYERISQGSDLSLFMRQRKGVCIDAATALAVILRYQKIPARISIGYKPERVEGGKVLYYTTGAHSVTEVYLPPYGWVQFDATPTLERNPLVKVEPFKKEASPGSKLFFQLSITNRRNMTDNFRLSVYNPHRWNMEAAPREIRIDPYQTADALLEVTIPEDANLGEKNLAILTVTSSNNREIAFSIMAITQVANVTHISTTTTLKEIGEEAIRGSVFSVNGTVSASNDEPVDNMTIFVYLTRNREIDGIVVGKGYSMQGDFQIESAVPYSMEIGDYKVILISLGTTQHAPSSSNSTKRIRATTRIELGSEDEFLIGYGAIHGRLTWDNGTGFASGTILLEMTSSAAPTEVWEIQNLTSTDGTFRIETGFRNVEAYEVKAMFSGDAYILGSSITRVIKLKSGRPTIQVSSENTAIRGEVFNVTGAVQFEDIGIWGEIVTITFDNELLSTVETGENGSYAYSFLVDSTERLGSHIVNVALEKDDIYTIHEVAVKSTAALTAKVSNVAGGVFHLLSTSLSDDQELPILGAEIVVDNYGLSGRTDENGNLTFLLDAVRLWPENLTLTVRFEGSELYLPDTTEGEIIFEPVASLAFVIPLVAPPSVTMVLVYATHLRKKRRALQQIGVMEVLKEGTVLEEKRTYRSQKMQPLRIIFPDIKDRFPNIWGAKEKLNIEIVLDKSVLNTMQQRTVEVFVDEERVVATSLSQQGHAELSHVFNEKGEHRIRAILPRTPLGAEIKLRVVEYREEIIRLYKKFLEELTSLGIYAQDEMTAREIESLILETDELDPESLHDVTNCFEKAEYSNRLPIREDYEIMYLSLKEPDRDVE